MRGKRDIPLIYIRKRQKWQNVNSGKLSLDSCPHNSSKYSSLDIYFTRGAGRDIGLT
jgi:hypothetical protein